VEDNSIYGRYGFADAFNPTTAWIGPDVTGIDVGTTLLAAVNLRTGNVWRWFMLQPRDPANAGSSRPARVPRWQPNEAGIPLWVHPRISRMHRSVDGNFSCQSQEASIQNPEITWESSLPEESSFETYPPAPSLSTKTV